MQQIGAYNSLELPSSFAPQLLVKIETLDGHMNERPLGHEDRPNLLQDHIPVLILPLDWRANWHMVIPHGDSYARVDGRDDSEDLFGDVLEVGKSSNGSIQRLDFVLREVFQRSSRQKGQQFATQTTLYLWVMGEKVEAPCEGNGGCVCAGEHKGVDHVQDIVVWDMVLWCNFL
jgi:hypothetical protein